MDYVQVRDTKHGGCVGEHLGENYRELVSLACTGSSLYTLESWVILTGAGSGCSGVHKMNSEQARDIKITGELSKCFSTCPPSLNVNKHFD